MVGLCDVVSSHELWLNIISDLRPRNEIYRKVQEGGWRASDDASDDGIRDDDDWKIENSDAILTSVTIISKSGGWNDGSIGISLSLFDTYRIFLARTFMYIYSKIRHWEGGEKRSWYWWRDGWFGEITLRTNLWVHRWRDFSSSVVREIFGRGGAGWSSDDASDDGDCGHRDQHCICVTLEISKLPVGAPTS